MGLVTVPIAAMSMWTHLLLLLWQPSAASEGADIAGHILDDPWGLLWLWWWLLWSEHHLSIRWWLFQVLFPKSMPKTQTWLTSARKPGIGTLCPDSRGIAAGGYDHGRLNLPFVGHTTFGKPPDTMEVNQPRHVRTFWCQTMKKLWFLLCQVTSGLWGPTLVHQTLCGYRPGVPLYEPLWVSSTRSPGPNMNLVQSVESMVSIIYTCAYILELLGTCSPLQNRCSAYAKIQRLT